MTFRVAILLAVPCLLSAITVTINPGDNIQNAVNANGTGTTFLLKSGYHRIPSAIVPKDNDIFNGEAGTKVSGAKVLSAFSVSGSNWVIGGQSQNAGQSGPGCLTGFDGCGYAEELFIDGVKLVHVALLSEIAPGKWFFDYPNQNIYIRDNPAGHLVETSVVAQAFVGGGNGVTIDGITIQMFANSAGNSGAINAGTSWTIQNSTITNVHGWGIYGNNNLIFRRNTLTHVGQLCLAGPTANAMLFEDNEIGFCNDDHFQYGGQNGEGGGSKFTLTTNLVVRGNYVHDNIGLGLWLDGSNYLWVFEGNHTTHNIDAGLMDEISYDGVMRYNVVENDAQNITGGLFAGGGIYWSSSPNLEIYGNYLLNCSNGIGGQDPLTRGSGNRGAFTVTGLNVHDNVIVLSPQTSGIPAGISSNNGSITFGSGANNHYTNNRYVLAGGQTFSWSLGDGESFAQWQAAGNDTGGAVFSGGTNLVGTNYNTGDTVTLTGSTTVRQLPFTGATAVATLPGGTGATISQVRGPIIAGGSTWWQANFVGGARGWVTSGSITAGSITVTAPAVTTTTATAVTSTGASSGGNVTSDGGATTTRGLCYATTSAPTTPCTSNGTGIGAFTSTLSGLSQGTTYHYRAFATNSNSTVYGAELTFTTTSPAPPLHPAPTLSGKVTRGGQVLILGGSSGGVAAPMVIISRGSTTQDSGAGTISSSPMNCTGANLVVAMTQSISSVTSFADNVNSGYSIAGESVEPSGNRITIAYMQNAAPSSALTVTATFSGGVFYTRIMTWCISGASTTAALDGTMVGAFGTTSPGATASLTPSGTGGIILAAISNDDGNTCTFGAANGFSLAFGVNGTLGGVDRHDTDAIELLGGVGAQTPSITMSSTGGAWRMAAAAFQPGSSLLGAVSPLGTDVYTKEEHFSMDYTKSVGQEATWTGMSLDPIHYPTDPRLSFIPSEESVLAIRNFGGHKYMYITDQFSGYVAYYRFVGEIAVPAGVIMGKGTFGSWVGGIIPTGSAFMWRDTNGDGNIQSGEIVNIRSPDASIWGWSVGTDGQVLAVSETNTIFTYAMSGIDSFGNPLYVDAVAATAPAPFTKLARIRYLTASDTMYLTGWTTDNPYFGSGTGTVGREIIRYDNWSTGNRTPHMRATLPYNPAFACLDDNTQTCPQYMKAFDVAGSRVVAGYLQTSQYADGHPMQDLLVFDADTGAQLGAILPGATVHNNEGWIDGAENLKMFQRPSGEYVIFREEVVWAKVLVYRMDPSPTITYRTSWLGNSLPGGQDGTAGGTWIPNFIEGMFVLADGTVFSNSAWDEAGGEAMLFKGGAVTQPFFAQAHFHGGKAAAVFGTSYYLSYSGGNPASNHGVRRYGVDGSLFVTSAVLNTTAFITGLTADGTSVYASDPANNRVVILDATTLAQTGTFAFSNPGRLVLASGSLWIVDTGTNKIRHFSTAGSFLGQEITDAGIPTALAIDNQGRLMVGDSGTRQQVLFYSPLSGTPTQVATFGISGGIYSGSSGLVAPTKLISPTGVGMDTAGNVYVSSSLAGSDLRAFNTSGALSWWLQGLEFVDVAVADPL